MLYSWPRKKFSFDLNFLPVEAELACLLLVVYYLEAFGDFRPTEIGPSLSLSGFFLSYIFYIYMPGLAATVFFYLEVEPGLVAADGFLSGGGACLAMFST
jgi:hypothetical protein